MKRLAEALDLPEEIISPNGVKEDRTTALAMLCKRLSWPVRLTDIELACGWERTRVSRITTTLMQYIFHRWVHLLRWDSDRLTPETLASFAERVSRKGSPLNNCCAFIDGTMYEVARPIQNQRLLYNGWKRIHCLKYHAVVSPDGMIIHVYGPVEGRRHDETIYQMSGLADILRKNLWSPSGDPLVIYVDPAYGLSEHLICPFESPQGQSGLRDEEKRWNYMMAKVRIGIEWEFGIMLKTWPACDGARDNRVLLSPVGLEFLTAVILSNARNILRPNQIAQHFNCPPPSLSEYFQGVPTESDMKVWTDEQLASSVWEEMDERLTERDHAEAAIPELGT